MNGKTQRSIAIAVGAMAIMLLVLLIGGISFFFPYVSPPKIGFLFHYYLPAVLVFFSVLLIVYGRWYRKHKLTQAHRNANSDEPNPFIMFLSMAAFLYVYSLLCSDIFAIPTKIFADRKVNVSVNIDYLDGFRANHGYWVWINYYRGEEKNRFMWRWSDLLVDQLRHGDCVELHGREWLLGFYVDSISRSTACKPA